MAWPRLLDRIADRDQGVPPALVVDGSHPVASDSSTVTDSAPKQPKAKQAKKDTSPPLSNWPGAAALAEITFEHCLRGLFQQIEGGLTVEQVIGKVADRARNR